MREGFRATNAEGKALLTGYGLLLLLQIGTGTGFAFLGARSRRLSSVYLLMFVLSSFQCCPEVSSAVKTSPIL